MRMIRVTFSILLLLLSTIVQAENLRWWTFPSDLVINYTDVSCSNGTLTHTKQYTGGNGNLETNTWLPIGVYTCWAEAYFGQLGYMKSNTVTKTSVGTNVSPPSAPSIY